MSSFYNLSAFLLFLLPVLTFSALFQANLAFLSLPYIGLRKSEILKEKH